MISKLDLYAIQDIVFIKRDINGKDQTDCPAILSANPENQKKENSFRCTICIEEAFRTPFAFSIFKLISY